MIHISIAVIKFYFFVIKVFGVGIKLIRLVIVTSLLFFDNLCLNFVTVEIELSIFLRMIAKKIRRL